MARTALKYGAVLIGMYLAVAYATGSGNLLTNAADGTAKVVRAFQAR
jgi:hypothetical protein